jgi:hypothetical protein
MTSTCGHCDRPLSVELGTRVSSQTLGSEQGLIGEVISSLYSLFAVTRQVLKEARPRVGATTDAVGGVAIEVLNRGIRPFPAKWHPLMLSWERERDPKTSAKDHEWKWPKQAEARRELDALGTQLDQYTHALGVMAGVLE